MNNNFNLKQYLSEGKLLNDIEVRMGNPSLKRIFDQYSQDVLDYDLFTDDEYNEEDRQPVRDALENAKYDTMDELIDSIYDVEGEIAEIYGHYPGDYTWETALQLNNICDDVNFSEKDKLEFLYDFLEREWDDNDWDEAEKEEYWNRFLDKLIPVKKGGKRGYWNKWRLIEINDQNLYIESTDPNDNKSIASCTAWGGKVKIHWPGSYQYTESSEEFVKDLKNALGDGVKNLTKNKFGVYDLEVNEKELKTLFNGTL
jgi:hypothetical protein